MRVCWRHEQLPDCYGRSHLTKLVSTIRVEPVGSITSETSVPACQTIFQKAAVHSFSAVRTTNISNQLTVRLHGSNTEADKLILGKRALNGDKHVTVDTQAGPYLGTLRPWAQEIFAPPPSPLFVFSYVQLSFQVQLISSTIPAIPLGK